MHSRRQHRYLPVGIGLDSQAQQHLYRHSQHVLDLVLSVPAGEADASIFHGFHAAKA